MVSRIKFFSDIQKKAEEDLKKLLIYKNPKPHHFNYSPYILRRVNEKLHENGQSIGLGYLSTTEIFEKYWNSASLPLQSELYLRIVFGTCVDCYDEIVVFIKNQQIKDKIIEELNQIAKLKPKNPLVFRFRTPHKDNTIDNICEQIRIIAVEKEIIFHTDVYYTEKEIEKLEEFEIQWNLPSNFKFECQRCNLCELPSSTSVNPIPNTFKNDRGELLTFDNRICFPSNLPTLLHKEAECISLETEIPLNELCKPVLAMKGEKDNLIDIAFALCQVDGICVFQDLEKQTCNIRDQAPLNCISYPLTISEVTNNLIAIDVDYSCLGVGLGREFDRKKLIDQIIERAGYNRTDTLSTLKELKEKWKGITVFYNEERVEQKEIDFAQNVYHKDED